MAKTNQEINVIGNVKKEETKAQKKRQDIVKENRVIETAIQQTILKPQYVPKMSGNLTALISAGFDDNKQISIFTTSKGLTYYGENYKYKDKNTTLNAVYRQKDDIQSLTEETRRKFEQLINNKVILSQDISTFTKKIFHLFHVYAFIQWHEKGYTKENIDNILAKDLTVEIPKKDIQVYFNVTRPYIAMNLTTAIATLRYIEILEFTTKRRDKGQIVTGGNDIKKLFTGFCTDKPKNVSLTYSLEYAKYLFNYGFVQYPFKIFASSNSVAFDILEYIYRYYFLEKEEKNSGKRKNPFIITRKKILENTKSIKSFKDVEENYNRKYKDRIYTPFYNAIAYINENYDNLLQVETIYTKEELQEQEKGIHEENEKANKEEWANRKMKITIIDEPDYR